MAHSTSIVGRFRFDHTLYSNNNPYKMYKLAFFLAVVAIAQAGIIAPVVPVAHPVVHPVAVSHSVVHPAPILHAPVVHAPIVHAAPVVPVVRHHAPFIAVHH